MLVFIDILLINEFKHMKKSSPLSHLIHPSCFWIYIHPRSSVNNLFKSGQILTCKREVNCPSTNFFHLHCFQHLVSLCSFNHIINLNLGIHKCLNNLSACINGAEGYYRLSGFCLHTHIYHFVVLVERFL